MNFETLISCNYCGYKPISRAYAAADKLEAKENAEKYFRKECKCQHDLQIQIGEEIFFSPYKKEEMIWLDSSHFVRISDGNVELISTKQTGENEKTETNIMRVIAGNFRPHKKLQLDGEAVFEVETAKKFRGNAVEILAQLGREGVIINRSKAADAINALLSYSKLEVVRGHASYGVFSDEAGGLSLCIEPQPRTESQAQIVRQVGDIILTPTSEQIKAWFDVLHFWRSYEIMPTMGLTIMSPFALELRRHGILVGYVFHLSPETGLGKTEVAKIFTRCLFGHELLSCDSVKSEYRMMDAVDSAGLALTIEEAENLPWDKFSAHLQMASEQPLQDKRGTPNLGSRPYLSRAVLLFSGNYFPTKRKALLVRTLVVHFDKTQKKERRQLVNKKALRDAEKNLAPIGFAVVKSAVDDIASINELVRRIESHADKIAEIYDGTFEDARRSTLWGIVYEGLQTWQRFALKNNVLWKAPDYEEFVRNVVSRVEPAAFESVEMPAETFVGWWQGWKAIHRSGSMDATVKGFEEIWDEGSIGKLRGDIISKAVLSLYEGEMRGKGFSLINSLPDLGRSVEAFSGLPFNEIYKVRRIGDKSYKTVFIPLEIVREIGKIEVTTVTNDFIGTEKVLPDEKHEVTFFTETKNANVTMLPSKSLPITIKEGRTESITESLLQAIGSGGWTEADIFKYLQRTHNLTALEADAVFERFKRGLIFFDTKRGGWCAVHPEDEI